MPFQTHRTAPDSTVQVLTLSGTMTMGTELQKFESTVEELTRNQHNRIVVDMSGISYLDSSALGVLVACHSIVKRANGQFGLAGLSDRVAKIITMGRVDGILVILPNKDAAVQKFRTEP